MDPHDAAEPPIRRVFREVVAEWFPGDKPAQAGTLFGAEVDPTWDDRGFLADFYSEILHQDTCQPHTAEGVPLLAALAGDGRVPARERFGATCLLFRAATVAERHCAESWPAAPAYADSDSEARARAAVAGCAPQLLGRWGEECAAVRLALGGLAVVFANDRTAGALDARLKVFVERYPPGTDVGDYVRFLLVTASQDEDRILTATERFTDAYWRGTARGAPVRARAWHLVGQMLGRIGVGLNRW